MMQPIRWGILGTGTMARQFAEGLKSASGAQLHSVGSRTADAAERFGNLFHVPRRHASYTALAEDPEVDVIYIATPHPLHKDNSTLCLNTGKAVLCEKPFTINRAEAETVVSCARRNQCFLMEAMWTRFLPIVRKVHEWVDSGIVGEVRMVRADFGFRAEYIEEPLLFAPEMGGGGLLDVGIYPISLAALFLGTQPCAVSSLATLGKTGVDEQNAILLQYSNGALAMAASAIRTETPQDACIIGEKGYILLHAPFWRGSAATLHLPGKEPQQVNIPLCGNGYNYEAEAVMECMRMGKKECNLMPLDDSIAIMGILDAVRAQWGLRYPME